MLFSMMHTHVAWLSFSRLISIMFCELPLTYFHRLPERKLLSGGVEQYFRISPSVPVNTLRPRRNRRHFADAIFKCIFLNENVWILIKISLKFVPKSPINNIPAMVQIMAWRRPGDKPLSEAMMVSLLTHICATRPQWVKCVWSIHIRKLMFEAISNIIAS